MGLMLGYFLKNKATTKLGGIVIVTHSKALASAILSTGIGSHTVGCGTTETIEDRIAKEERRSADDPEKLLDDSHALFRKVSAVLRP
jgi:hypothetical protein